MCILPVFAGLDYHDAFVKVCILDSDGSQLANRNRPNDRQANAALAQRFSSVDGATRTASMQPTGARRWPMLG